MGGVGGEEGVWPCQLDCDAAYFWFNNDIAFLRSRHLGNLDLGDF